MPKQKARVSPAAEQRMRDELRDEVLDNLTTADIQRWAANRGLELVKRATHVPLPSDGVADFRCTCGFAGSIPCPIASRRLA